MVDLAVVAKPGIISLRSGDGNILGARHYALRMPHLKLTSFLDRYGKLCRHENVVEDIRKPYI
jgi:hypothetical protein